MQGKRQETQLILTRSLSLRLRLHRDALGKYANLSIVFIPVFMVFTQHCNSVIATKH